MTKGNNKNQRLYVIAKVSLEEWFPEAVMDAHVKDMKHHIRKNHMKDYLYQKAMDTSPCGCFNYAALDNLRKNVEGLGLREQGLIPSSSAVKNCAYLLEAYGRQLGLGFKEVETSMGYAYKFDFDMVLRLTIERHGLTKFGLEGCTADPVLLAVNLDGVP